MVDIYTLCDTALGTLNLPFYYGMPTFDEASPEPECYIVYEDTDQPEEWAGDTENATEYSITVNLFKPFVDSDFKKSVKDTMKASGFIYQGGGKIGIDSDYPFITQYYQEYKISLEE